MEEAIARVKFPAVEGTGGKDEEDEQEVTRAMVARQNRKGKKSGGFQSMGRPVCLSLAKPCSYHLHSYHLHGYRV